MTMEPSSSHEVLVLFPFMQAAPRSLWRQKSFSLIHAAGRDLGLWPEYDQREKLHTTTFMQFVLF